MLGDTMGKKGVRKAKMCAGKLSRPVVWVSVTRLGCGPLAEQGASSPTPVTQEAWLPNVHTWEGKPPTQYPSCTFNLASQLSHFNWGKGS